MRFISWCKRHIPLLIVAGVLILDQASKFWIKLSMRIGDEIPVFSWFRIHFLENEGMAFGLSFGENFGKLLLSPSCSLSGTCASSTRKGWPCKVNWPE